MINSVFSKARLPMGELCQLQLELKSESERKAAASGIASVIGNLKDLTGLEASSFESLGNLGRDTLQNGLRMYLEEIELRQGNVHDALQDALRIAREVEVRGVFGPRFVNAWLEEVSNKAPFEVWEVIHSQGGPEADTSLWALVAARMANVDPAKAMSSVVESGSSIGVKPVFANWLQFDPKEASAWYESNIGRLPQDTKNQVSAAFAVDATRKGDLDQAGKWVSAIDDVELRKKVEGQVWTVERDSLRKEVGKDPAGTVQGIVSGQSKYADYWIEEAMGTWIAKEPEKAEDWYNKNWNSLPKGKAQYLAAAYANQALKQGDAATASQWAALIQDPKTKQRLEAAINKAGGTGGQ